MVGGRKPTYMPRPAQLEELDSFEGTMPKAEFDWWDDLAASSDPEKTANLIAARAKVFNFAATLRLQYFISCWHMGEHENYAFWKIYANTESVAIVSDFVALENSLPEHILVGTVAYIDYESESLPKSRYNMYDYIMHKRCYYSYEHEVRAVAALLMNNATEDILMNIVAGSYAPKLCLPDLIHEVVVSPCATVEFTREVEDFCREYALPVPRSSGLSRKPIGMDVSVRR